MTFFHCSAEISDERQHGTSRRNRIVHHVRVPRPLSKRLRSASPYKIDDFPGELRGRSKSPHCIRSKLRAEVKEPHQRHKSILRHLEATIRLVHAFQQLFQQLLYSEIPVFQTHSQSRRHYSTFLFQRCAIVPRKDSQRKRFCTVQNDDRRTKYRYHLLRGARIFHHGLRVSQHGSSMEQLHQRHHLEASH